MLHIDTLFNVRMGLLVFSVVKLCKYHQQENIRVSMAKERKRLIKEDLITEVPRPGRDNPAQVFTFKVLKGLLAEYNMTEPSFSNFPHFQYYNFNDLVSEKNLITSLAF